jgi:hypothetical protein
MSDQQPVLMMNIDGVIYPVGMTEEQVLQLKIFVAGMSKGKPFSLLKKVPVAESFDIAMQINEQYGLKVVK